MNSRNTHVSTSRYGRLSELETGKDMSSSEDNMDGRKSGEKRAMSRRTKRRVDDDGMAPAKTPVRKKKKNSIDPKPTAVPTRPARKKKGTAPPEAQCTREATDKQGRKRTDRRTTKHSTTQARTRQTTRANPQLTDPSGAITQLRRFIAENKIDEHLSSQLETIISPPINLSATTDVQLATNLTDISTTAGDNQDGGDDDVVQNGYEEEAEEEGGVIEEEDVEEEAEDGFDEAKGSERGPGSDEEDVSVMAADRFKDSDDEHDIRLQLEPVGTEEHAEDRSGPGLSGGRHNNAEVTVAGFVGERLGGTETPVPARPPPVSSIDSRGPEVDESTVAHILDAVKQCVKENIEKAVSDITGNLRKDLDEVAKVRDHISELSNAVTTTASAMFIKQNTAVPRLKEIHRTICVLPALFSDSFVLNIMAHCILGIAKSSIGAQRTMFALQQFGSELFAMLFFARQPKETRKEKFSSDTGKKFSKFRNGVMLSAFLAMQTNRFGTFCNGAEETLVASSVEASATDQETADYGNPSEAIYAVQQPFWLKPRFVRTEHCLAAAKKYEKRGANGQDNVESSNSVCDNESVDASDSNVSATRQKPCRSGPITSDEIALEASCLVYKIITTILYRSRKTSKMALFQGVLYLFSTWDQFDAPVSQMSLKLRWRKQTFPAIDYLRDLPMTEAIHANERLRPKPLSTQQIDMKNMWILEKFISEHPEFSLIVQHDVVVDGERRPLTYQINLIEVATKFFASFISIEAHPKTRDALCLDSKVFSLIITLAFGLRRLTEKAVHDMNESGGVPWARRNTQQTTPRGKRGRPRKTTVTESTPLADSTRCQIDDVLYSFEVVNGMSIDTLQPAPSKQRDYLLQMILTLTEEEYLGRRSSDGPPGDTVNGTSNENCIKPDESLGIFAV